MDESDLKVWTSCRPPSSSRAVMMFLTISRPWVCSLVKPFPGRGGCAADPEPDPPSSPPSSFKGNGKLKKNISVMSVFLLIIILNQHTYKNCRVIPAFFRFSIITSSWSSDVCTCRSVNITTFRQLYFFPLHNQRHASHRRSIIRSKATQSKNMRKVISHGFLLQEIHAHNKSIEPWQRSQGFHRHTRIMWS